MCPHVCKKFIVVYMFGSVTSLWALLSVCWSVGWCCVGWSVGLSWFSIRAGSDTSMLLSEHMVKLEILENASTQLLYSKSKVLKIKLFAKLFINAWIGQKIVAHTLLPRNTRKTFKVFWHIVYRGDYEQAQRSISSLSFVIVGVKRWTCILFKLFIGSGTSLRTYCLLIRLLGWSVTSVKSVVCSFY